MDKLTGIISSAELMGGQIVGMRGLKGDKGDTGNTATIAVGTTTTGAAGTSASVTNSGDNHDAVFNFTIPKGDKGDTGATGNGISSITLTDTTGSVKTYTITFTNGDTTTFQVTDGEVTNAILEKVLPTDTKSGSIASFPDGTDLFPALSCVADIDPVQDLHGYDKPWVGGGHYNQWDEEWELGALDSIGGDYPSSTEIRTKNYIPITPDATYYLYSGVAGTFNYRFYDSNKTFVSGSYIGRGNTLTAPNNAYYMRFYMGSAYGTTYNNNIAINYPHTVTTYSPYSNICPISGWSGVDVSVCGVNILNPSLLSNATLNTSNGTITVGSTNRICAYKVPVRPNKQITVSVQSPYQIGSACTYDKDGNYLSTISLSNWVSGSHTFDIPNGAYYFTTNFRESNNANISPSDLNVQIEFGNVTHTYKPYNGTTYTVSWSGDAGTVYGGTVDVVSGELTVDRVGQTISGGVSLYGNYGVDNKPLFYFDLSTAIVPYASKNAPLSAQPISSKYSAIDTYAVTEMKNGQIRTKDTEEPTTTRIYIRDDRFTTAAQINADLASTPLTIVGKLATPTTYTLTAQQVDLLLGQNTVFADTGDVTVEYKADIQRYIAKKLAE